MFGKSELLIIVTPELFDPNAPRARDLLPLTNDPANPPAMEAIQKRLPPAAPTRPVTPPPGE